MTNSVEDNILVRYWTDQPGGEALPDQVLTNTEELIEEINIGGTLGCMPW